jgi:hypothetical protein
MSGNLRVLQVKSWDQRFCFKRGPVLAGPFWNSPAAKPVFMHLFWFHLRKNRLKCGENASFPQFDSCNMAQSQQYNQEEDSWQQA